MLATREGGRTPGRWVQLGGRLSTKLIALLVTAMVVIFALLGYLNIRLHRRHLEAATRVSAERVSDVIKRSTSYSMLRNDREGLYHIITTMADEPGMVRIRIFNQEGRISFSTDPREVNTYVDTRAEACHACHARTQPLEHLDRPDRFRIYAGPGGRRVMGVINPIENQPSCWEAACHAHPPDVKILGVLDTNLSLAQDDADLAESTWQMVIHTVLAVMGITLLTGVFIWRYVHGPLARLKAGTDRLADGDLGYQVQLQSRDELGELADSFDRMSRQLQEANQEITSWTRMLEERVGQKTRELQRAHEHVLHVEKMASIGRLSAVVAHEINNPLSGILTYAKLLKKWLGQPEWKPDRVEQALGSLDLIESESRRCGEIVRNLMMFARSTPINFEWADLNDVLERSVRLVQHQAEVSGVELQLELPAELPRVRCDAGQVQQLLVALVMNAIEATPSGGSVRVRTGYAEDSREALIEVEDEGPGIDPELRERIFEPFFTTKEAGRGVGLGLAVSYSIVERHQGRIEVQSEPGRGALFTVRLPIDGAEGYPGRPVEGETAAEAR